MAHIEERKIKSGSQYRLVESHREDGKVRHIRTYLGTKRPWPKSQGWKNLSQEQVQRAKRKAARREVRPSPNPLLPEGKYAVIYADPPWRYDFSETDSRAIESHYESFPIEEICFYKDKNGVPIQTMFAENAILFLWAPQPKIREALQVIDAWGFEYRTGAVWAKDKIGMGYYFREKHELLLIAKKGDIAVPEPQDRQSSIIIAPRLGHSQKPNRVYRII